MPNACTTARTMCPDCCLEFTKIPRTVPESILECPPNAHPVIFRASMMTTPTSANKITQRIQTSLTGIYGTSVPVYAAIRRAETRTECLGKWHNLATSDVPASQSSSSGTRSSGKFTDKLPKNGFLFTTTTRRQFEHAKERADTKLRDLSILIDFPTRITPGGDFEGIVGSLFGKIEGQLRAEYPDGDKCLHRLQWFSDKHEQKVNTHSATPNIVTVEPRSQSSSGGQSQGSVNIVTIEPRSQGSSQGSANGKRVDPWARKDCFVRKKNR
ncbi:hypothetical protein BJX70DRAFT_395079 [Aspergillus crustosus]